MQVFGNNKENQFFVCKEQNCWKLLANESPESHISKAHKDTLKRKNSQQQRPLADATNFNLLDMEFSELQRQNSCPSSSFKKDFGVDILPLDDLKPEITSFISELKK